MKKILAVPIFFFVLILSMVPMIINSIFQESTDKKKWPDRQELKSFVWAQGGDLEALEDALAIADTGDTIRIPAGEYMFDKSLVIPAGISLMGAGKDKTIFTLSDKIDNSMIIFDGSNGEAVRFSGITLKGHGDETTLDRGLTLINNCQNFRVFDSRFEDFGLYGVNIHGGTSKGVVDHCEFIHCYKPGYGYGIYVNGSGSRDEVLPGDESWGRPLELGTENAVFIEDCYFDLCRHGVASGYGARQVVRYCTFERTQHSHAIDAHGSDPDRYRGTRSYEWYHNLVTGGSTLGYADGCMPRGGDGVIFNNRFELRGYGILLGQDHLAKDVCYPGHDQIRDCYIWRNRKNGKIVRKVYNTDGGNPTYKIFLEPPGRKIIEFLKVDRDFFFHKKPGYEPYTYPHPLTKKPFIRQ